MLLGTGTGTPPNLNDQPEHRWGGEHFWPPSSKSTTDQPSRTLIGRDRQNPLPQSLSESRAGFIASSSDDLFHPTTNNLPSSNTTVPSSHTCRYTLPNVSQLPLHPDPRYAYTQPPVGSSRPLPYSSSSYHNPSFEIPPPHHHSFYTGPAPAIPPSSFVHQPTQDTFYHQSQPLPPGHVQSFPRPPAYPRPHPSSRSSSRTSRRSSPSPTRSKTLPSVTHSYVEA